MKILITGANGMLAKAVRERFKEHELILTDVTNFEKLDITNYAELDKFVTECKPEVIINCAAYTAVDKAEEEEELARKINANGPRNLALTAEKNGAVLVHISTDYVFGGHLSTQFEYNEKGKKEPETVYGKTKLEGEELIEELSTKYYIFRTAWLYGDGNNFVRTMIKLSKQREYVDVVADQHGSPTYAVDLADIIYQALEKRIPFGIYHTTNLGNTTWYDFTKEIFKIANIDDCEVYPVTSEEFVRPAKRPENSQLSKKKILSKGITIPDWQDGLARYLKEELQKNKITKE